MYDLIVVGGGPAGLTAAMYAIRKRLNVLLVSKDLGGKTNFHLELPDMERHWVISGTEIVDKFKNELEYLKFARHMEPVEKIDRLDDGTFVVHTRGGGELATKAVIIATGTRQKFLEVPGEREYLSKGLCYSALSYAPLFIDKRTAVIGQGELALRSAAELSIVANHVHIVGPTKEALSTPLGQKILASQNVTIMQEYQVTEVLGNGYANRLRVKSPDGEQVEISFDGAFVEKALVANTEMVADLVKLDENGCIQVNCRNETSVPGIFAAGDVTSVYAEQVLVAVGEGAKAALSAYDYLLPLL
ncbi:MAG: FAD-dependent oxidoreductase [Anaerolineales bacterium]|nr:FAD-dependent oxidoreductase [Anaerolineales bacterium]MCB8990431.1 FAD-dependent oxidoreductase [Ardenticatenaceae bacterium]MCB9003445.1 FAD-dependent oxidoreductase [Ardenticatenaceae bacterium]